MGFTSMKICVMRNTVKNNETLFSVHKAGHLIEFNSSPSLEIFDFRQTVHVIYWLSFGYAFSSHT